MSPFQFLAVLFSMALSAVIMGAAFNDVLLSNQGMRALVVVLPPFLVLSVIRVGKALYKFAMSEPPRTEFNTYAAPRENERFAPHR